MKSRGLVLTKPDLTECGIFYWSRLGTALAQAYGIHDRQVVPLPISFTISNHSIGKVIRTSITQKKACENGYGGRYIRVTDPWQPLLVGHCISIQMISR